MEEKKNKNYLLKGLIVSFVLFLIFYISKEAGYYEYKMYSKTKLTEESIKKFENDVNEGKDVSIEKYIAEEYVDYSNVFTDVGSSIGLFFENTMNSGIKKTLKVLNKLFYE